MEGVHREQLFENGYMTAAASKKFLQDYEGDIRVQLQATGAKVVR